MSTGAVDSTLALTNSKQRSSAPNCSNASFTKIQLKVKLYTMKERGETSSRHLSKHSEIQSTGMVLNTNLIMGYGLHDIVPQPFNYSWSSSLFVTTSNLFSKLFFDLFICVRLLALIPCKPESNLTLLTTVAGIKQSQAILICCHDTNSLWLPHLRGKYQSKENQRELIDNFRTAT